MGTLYTVMDPCTIYHTIIVVLISENRAANFCPTKTHAYNQLILLAVHVMTRPFFDTVFWGDFVSFSLYLC